MRKRQKVRRDSKHVNATRTGALMRKAIREKEEKRVGGKGVGEQGEGGGRQGGEGDLEGDGDGGVRCLLQDDFLPFNTAHVTMRVLRP